jgi:predicted nucleotidyltransferase
MITEYESQNVLNPALWDNEQFDAKLRAAFIRIAKHFIEFLDVPVKVKDITLTGSNVNYNWTPHSDIDIHVVLDYSKINKNTDLVANLMRAKKSIWNNNYPLQHDGMDIELYAQDDTDAPAGAGVYSLLHDKWIVKPDSEKVTVKDADIIAKSEPFAYMIDNLNANQPNVLSRIKALIYKLRKFRQCGLDKAGEYSLENLAFKRLRTSGHLNQLKNLHKQVVMADLKQGLTEGCGCGDTPDVKTILGRHIHSDQRMTATDWKFLLKHMDTVVDPRGQWDHPGRCTLIPSNQITMQNVAYPVYGIDDTGHAQMMQPEQNYTYPGRMVFEIPMTSQSYKNLVKEIETWNQED